MRDLLLFAVCCGLAAAYWVTSQRRYEERSVAMQAELYQLGAPQTMDDSPERSLLLGEFAKGLRAEPREETYRKLAPLFLATHQTDGGKTSVLASAFHQEGMTRVAGKSLQFFDPRGDSVEPRLWKLGASLEASEKPLFEVAGPVTLVADWPWLVYGDKKRWAAFRFFGDELRGYISSKKISVDRDELLIDGKKAWRWSQGQLEATKA